MNQSEENRIDGKTLQEWINERMDDETVLLDKVLGATIGVKLAFPFLRPVGSKRHPSGCRARAAELNLQQAVCTEQAGSKG